MNKELLQNAVTELLANGFLDEGVELSHLLTNLKAQTGKPVCPHCQEQMSESRYEGYYDKFDMWVCGCESFPDDIEKEVGKGAYA